MYTGLSIKVCERHERSLNEALVSVDLVLHVFSMTIFENVCVAVSFGVNLVF